MGRPAGNKAGLIERQANLDQEGDCWISERAYALHNSRVTDNAFLRDVAGVCGNAVVGGDIILAGSTVIDDNARLFGKTLVGPNCTL